MTTNSIEKTFVQSINTMNSALDEIKNRRRLWFYIYTLTFLFTFAFAFSPFLLQGRGFVWYIDGRMQTYPWLAYVGQRVRSTLAGFLKGDFTVPLYDLSMGWGDDIIGFMGSYAQLDPVAVFLSALVPIAFTETLYSFIIIMRLYLAGLAFIYMCLHFCKRPFESYIGSILYLFCAYATYTSTAYPYFVIFMILFPLLITGADKILKRERGGLFIFCVFYAAICSYYFLFISTLMAGLFALLRFFDLYGKGNRKTNFMLLLGRGIGLYFLGLALAAPILIPGIFELLQSGRNDYSHIAISTDFYVHWRYFWERFLTLITPKREYDLEWGLDFPCFAAIALPAISIQFSKKQNRTLKWLLGMALLCLFSPLGGLIMNGFQYPSNRWAFGLSLVVAYSVTDSISVLFQAEEREKRICLITLSIYAAIAIIASMGGATISYPLLGVGFLAVTTVFIITASGNLTLNRTCRLKKALCVVLVILNVGINSIYMFSSNLMGWVNRFELIGNETLMLAGSMEANASEMPYREGMQDGRINSNSLFYNYSMVYGIPGTNIYTTTLNENVNRFWNELECSGNLQEFRIYSTGQQTMLDALLSVKHQMKWEDGTDYIPYGYNEVGSFMRTLVYENQYALPWGYTYSDTVSVESLNGLNGVEKQEILLQAVALDEGKTPASAFPMSSKDIPYTADYSDCIWKDGRLYVGSPDANITLHADLDGGKEYYLRIAGLNIDGYGDQFVSVSAKANIDFYVECGGASGSGRAMAKEYPWYYGRENYLFCLGCSNLNRDTVTIQFPAEGVFYLDTIELIELPLDSYVEHVEKLRAESLEDIVVASNRITGIVDVSADKILCLSVPYARGWIATIDGEQVPILRANYAFMGIQVPQGQHVIEFRYFTPGLKAGLCIGAFGLIALLLYLNSERKVKVKRKDSKKEQHSLLSDYTGIKQNSGLPDTNNNEFLKKKIFTSGNATINRILAFFREYYLDVFFIQVVFFIVCLHKSFITYETNDDFYMSMLVNGAWGQPTDHLVFINVLLGRLLRLLVSKAPSIGWYYYFQASCCVIAFICIGIVIKRRNSLVYWLILPACLWLIERECYQSMQFTKTAGILAAAGALLIIDSFEWDKGHTMERILGCLLVIVSTLFRFNSGIMVCGVFSVYAFRQVLKGRRIGMTICAVWVATFALCFAASAYNSHIYQSEPDWGRFEDFNKKRTLINDWNISDWNDYFSTYADDYQQAGIDPNDLLMMRYWSFTDPDVFSTEFVDTAVAIKKDTMSEYRHKSSYMHTYFQEMINRITAEPLLYILIGVLIIWFVVCRTNALALLGIPLMLLSALLYCYHIDRYWNHRLLFSLLSGAIVVLVFMIAKSGISNVRPVFGKLSIFLTVLSIASIWVQGTISPGTENNTLQYTLQKINEQDGSLYVFEPLDNILSDSIDVRTPPQQASCRNICDAGGWLVNSPVVAQTFAEHHIVNPWKECIDNDKIYFVDHDRIINKLNYIRRHYSPDANARLVRLSSGMTIYNITTEDIPENLSTYDENTNDIEYYTDCSIDGQQFIIEGTICKEHHSSFDQRVFIKISRKGMPDVDCAAVQVEDWTFPPEDERHFAGFIGKTNIEDLKGKDLRVYLYLKSDALHRIEITNDIQSVLNGDES